jgi:hypothetical protein
VGSYIDTLLNRQTALFKLDLNSLSVASRIGNPSMLILISEINKIELLSRTVKTRMIILPFIHIPSQEHILRIYNKGGKVDIDITYANLTPKEVYNDVHNYFKINRLGDVKFSDNVEETLNKLYF